MTHYTVIGQSKTRAARVLWMLEELGLPYDHLPALPRSEDVTAHNPTGKVPVLLVDDATLTDSTAICQFLADRHGALTYPAGTVQRGQQDGFTHQVLDELDAVLWTAARHSFILPPEQRVPDVKPSLKWEFARNLSAIAARMGDGPFVMGDQMTVPDIVLSHCLLWARGAKFDMNEPVMADYAARMMARPAFQRAMAR